MPQGNSTTGDVELDGKLGGLGEVRAAVAAVHARVRRLELENLQLRTKYLHVQLHLLELERGHLDDDPDAAVLRDQVNALRDRILGFEPD